MSSSVSRIMQFLPISPRPPSGMTRSVSAIVRRGALALAGSGSALARAQADRVTRRLPRSSPSASAGIFEKSSLMIWRRLPAWSAAAGWYMCMKWRSPIRRSLPVHLADRVLGEEPAQREAPKRDDQLRVDEFDLAQEVLAAGLDLFRQRVAVVGRPALEDVGDVDVGRVQADRGEQFVEELAAGADERARPAGLRGSRALRRRT